MKVFHLFIGLCFLISIASIQNVEAGSPIPCGLEYAIENVKTIKSYLHQKISLLIALMGK